MSIYEKVKTILEDEKLFHGQRRVTVLRALAETNCPLSRRKTFSEQEKLLRQQKCVRRKMTKLWWTFFRQREPVTVGDAVVQLKGNEIILKKVE